MYIVLLLAEIYIILSTAKSQEGSPPRTRKNRQSGRKQKKKTTNETIRVRKSPARKVYDKLFCEQPRTPKHHQMPISSVTVILRYIAHAFVLSLCVPNFTRRALSAHWLSASFAFSFCFFSPSLFEVNDSPFLSSIRSFLLSAAPLLCSALLSSPLLSSPILPSVVALSFLPRKETRPLREGNCDHPRKSSMKPTELFVGSIVQRSTKSKFVIVNRQGESVASHETLITQHHPHPG